MIFGKTCNTRREGIEPTFLFSEIIAQNQKDLLILMPHKLNNDFICATKKCWSAGQMFGLHIGELSNETQELRTKA